VQESARDVLYSFRSALGERANEKPNGSLAMGEVAQRAVWLLVLWEKLA
jgi:hypothetical protein